jgi:hypothetical protein
MPSLNTRLCSNCEGAGLELYAGGQVICRYCGTVNALDGVVCPHCEHLNAAGAEVCGHCRQSLVRACPACGARNWAGAETCRHCAASLDTVALMSSRLRTDPAERFNEQQRSSRTIKEQEAFGAERRMAEFNAMEARRQAGLREAQARKAAEQRLLLIGTVAVVFVILAAVAVSVILTNLR